VSIVQEGRSRLPRAEAATLPPRYVAGHPPSERERRCDRGSTCPALSFRRRRAARRVGRSRPARPRVSSSPLP